MKSKDVDADERSAIGVVGGEMLAIYLQYAQRLYTMNPNLGLDFEVFHFWPVSNKPLMHRPCLIKGWAGDR